MSALTFTIERTSEYQWDAGKYPYTAEQLAGAKYVLTLNNGDSHLVKSVAEFKDLVDAELWLAGFEDEEEAHG